MIGFPRSHDRRSERAAIVLLFLVLLAGHAGVASGARLHATLLRSSPAAKSRLAVAPDTIRLVFSEQVVPELSQISIVGTDGRSISLKVANDPHDVHTLVSRVAVALGSGTFKVVWRVLSADGHPVGGNYEFTVAQTADPTLSTAGTTAPAVPTTSLPVDSMSTHGHTGNGPEEKPVPILASLLRGLGLGLLMAGVGVLFFGLTSRDHRHLAARTLTSRSITGGAVLLVIHAVLWMKHIAPNGALSGAFVGSLLGSFVGRVEAARTALALLAFLAIVVARRRKAALVLGVACIVVSGAIGHPAAIDPSLAVPAKVVHLIAASVWLGGLIWLVWLARCDDAACRLEARRVSSMALIAVILIAASGLVQAVLFLSTPSDLIHTTYGKLVLAKIIGLALLVGYGAYNRLGLLPAIDAVEGPRRLSRSVRQEIVLVTALILIGGFLAYVPTPPVSPALTAGTTGSIG